MAEYKQSLGEMWLRGKLEAYDAAHFHRVDPPLLRAALADVMKTLDELRWELEDIRFHENSRD